MTSILSIFISLILAFTGTTMPAMPETTTTYTLKNIAFEVDGQQVAFAPELKLETSVGSELIALSGSVESQGQTLFPVAIQLENDALAVSLPNANCAYRVTSETLESLVPAELFATVQGIVPVLTSVIEGYVSLLDNFEVLAQLGASGLNALIEKNGENAREISVEIDGKQYQGAEFDLRLNAQSFVDYYKAFDEAGVAEFDQFSSAYATLMNIVQGTNYTKASEIIEAMINDLGLPTDKDLVVTMKVAGEGDTAFIEVSTITEIEGVQFEFVFSETAIAGTTSFDLTILGQDEEVLATLTLAGEASDLFGDAPALTIGMNLNAAANEDDDASNNPFVKEGEYTHELIDMYVDLDFAVVDGLEKAALSFSAEGEEVGAKLALDLNSEEKREADGSVTEYTAISAEVEGTGKASISYELNKAIGAYKPIDFSGAKELTAETFADGSAEGQAMMMDGSIISNSMQMDLMRLMQDPSLQPLLASFMN